MSNFVTPRDAARSLRCPLARTFGTNDLSAKCQGPSCALWRWKPRLASDPEFVSAVQREMACMAQEDGRGKSAMTFHAKAVARVTRNPEGYGAIREEGYCGLGGVPT